VITARAPRLARAGRSVVLGDNLGEQPVSAFCIGGPHLGALTAADGAKLAAAADRALSLRVPLVGVMASSGAEVADGVDALHGWGTAARALARCSGAVPIVLAVVGPALSGPALLLGMADVVVMTEDAFAYISGPSMVAAVTGMHLTPTALGGADAHARHTGVAALVAVDAEEAAFLLEDVLGYLPRCAEAPPPFRPTTDPAERRTPSVYDLVPSRDAESYDVRGIVREIVDDGILLELRAQWAPNMVTGLASIAGMPVGVVANQPQVMAGTVDIPASQKAARFVRFCDAFNIPLVTVVDTPGFLPGAYVEWRGMIRYGAQLAAAYAEATVPRVCLILRKAYGGAYIVMDCKAMGNDMCLAWPTAEVAVMGASSAVAILHRGAPDHLRTEQEVAYRAGFSHPYIAAERGYVDAVIDPAETRPAIAAALSMLRPKQEPLPRRRHDNVPV